jgi:hypothetical protein
MFILIAYYVSLVLIFAIISAATSRILDICPECRSRGKDPEPKLFSDPDPGVHKGMGPSDPEHGGVGRTFQYLYTCLKIKAPFALSSCFFCLSK